MSKLVITIEGLSEVLREAFAGRVVPSPAIEQQLREAAPPVVEREKDTTTPVAEPFEATPERKVPRRTRKVKAAPVEEEQQASADDDTAREEIEPQPLCAKCSEAPAVEDGLCPTCLDERTPGKGTTAQEIVDASDDVPAALASAEKLRDVVAYLADHGCSNADELVAACMRYKDRVPALQRVGSNLDERVRRAAEVFGVGLDA